MLPPLVAPYPAHSLERPVEVLNTIQDITTKTPHTLPDFDKEVLEPLRAKQAADAEKARLEAERIEAERVAAVAAAEAARIAAIPKPVVRTTYVPQSFSGELSGSFGYSLAYGNCVNQAPVYLRAPGNPIQWPVTTYTPYIGGVALFPYNHVARVVGIWSNGDIEVAQENAPGMPHRFPVSAFRGFR